MSRSNNGEAFQGGTPNKIRIENFMICLPEASNWRSRHKADTNYVNSLSDHVGIGDKIHVIRSL